MTRDRQELFNYDALLHHRLELVVNNKHFVDLFVFGESLDHVPRYFERLRKLHPPLAGESYIFARERCAAAAEEVAAFAAHGENFNLFSGIGSDKCLRRLDQIRIEGTTESFVSRDQDEEIAPITTRIEQRMMKVFIGAIGKSGQHFRHLVREGTGSDNAILRTLELCRGDHLHGLGDLLRVLDRLDTPANV